VHTIQGAHLEEDAVALSVKVCVIRVQVLPVLAPAGGRRRFGRRHQGRRVREVRTGQICPVMVGRRRHQSGEAQRPTGSASCLPENAQRALAAVQSGTAHLAALPAPCNPDMLRCRSQHCVLTSSQHGLLRHIVHCRHENTRSEQTRGCQVTVSVRTRTAGWQARPELHRSLGWRPGRARTGATPRAARPRAARPRRAR